MPISSALCIQNDGYPVALELWQNYQILIDPAAEERGLVRVIDETGEDYLYPRSFFVAFRPEGAQA